MLTKSSTPPHRPNWKMAGSDEKQLMKSEAAVVALAKKSGTPACRTVHERRSARRAGAPSRSSCADWPQVSERTKMLSALTPMTTHSEAPAKADSLAW